MRSIMLLMLVLIQSVVFSQKANDTIVLPKYGFGLLGGVSFNQLENVYPSIFAEGKFKTIGNTYIKISAGYHEYVSNEPYTVNTFGHIKIGDDYEKYQAITYRVNKIDYGIIPILFGLQYYFTGSTYSPYLFGDFCFNFLNPTAYKSTYVTLAEYDTEEEIPEGYRKPHVLKTESTGFMIGAGALFKLTQSINMDMRYVYKIEDFTDNTHQVLLGIGI